MDLAADESKSLQADGSDRQRLYCNPVLDQDFPDPCVIRGSDGHFYAYATQGEQDGKLLNVQLARSTDLVDWEPLGEALPEKPSWSAPDSPVMAPNAITAGDQVVLYFAAGRKDGHGMCTGAAVADDAAGPFKPTDEPVVCGDNYNCIDPFPFREPSSGRHLLYWGSGIIQVRELSSEWTRFADSSRTEPLLRPAPPSAAKGHQRLVEAASVVVRDGRYFLFYSGDNCCHGDPHYAVMVARSNSAKGPFERHTPLDSTDNLLLQSNGRWDAPGHCTIIRDDSGADWILYHAIDKRRPEPRDANERKKVRRVLLLDRIRWEDGWPKCDGPSHRPRPAPVFNQR